MCQSSAWRLPLPLDESFGLTNAGGVTCSSLAIDTPLHGASEQTSASFFVQQINIHIFFITNKYELDCKRPSSYKYSSKPNN